MVPKLLWYYLGLIVVCSGYAMVIKPGLGAAPWDIFHLGVNGRTGIKLSLIIQLTGVIIILINWTLAIRPSIGMLLNMLSVGPILSSILSVLEVPHTLPGRWLMLLAGVFVAGFGTALYISADMGPGPRDGMMVGLTRRLGVPVAVVKNSIDVTVALVGWWLGGPLGLGTLVVALSLGPLIQFGMSLVVRLAKLQPLSTFVRPVSLKRS